MGHIYQLGKAFRDTAATYYQSAAIKWVAATALTYWFANDFICDNWWWNEMGVPNQMINILLVFDEALPDSQQHEGMRIAGRANMEASGARPGGDQIQIAASFFI